MSNILSGIPKPILKKAEQIIQNAIEESEMRESLDSTGGQTSLNPNVLSKIVHRETITLNEIIAWAKSHYPDEESVKFIVMKEKSDNLDYDFVLYLLYLKDNKPLLGGEYKSMAVYSQRMDDSLYETFNNSDIIEFE